MAEFDPDAYLAKPFDPDSYLKGAAPAVDAATPMAPRSLPGGNERSYSIPSTIYSEEKARRGIMRRMNEGAAAPIQDLGISEEHRKQYPFLNHVNPYARTAEAIAKTPASAWGGITGAAAGLAEKLGMSPAWADRLQRDIGVLPVAVAPEVPVAAPEAAAMRRASRPPGAPVARPPPLPASPPPLPAEVSAIPRQVERPNVGVGLLNTDVPHELPGAQSRALSAAGTGGPLAEMSPDTIAFLRKKMEEQGYNQHTIDQRLSEMSAHHFFGEITASLEGDMGGIAGHAGPGRLEIMGSTRQRALEARERVQHIFDRAFGPNENLAQLRRTMDIDRQHDAGPFYERFRATPITPTPQIDALLPRLEAAGVLQRANQALRMEGEAATNGFPIAGEPPTTKYVPTASAFQLAAEELGSMIKGAMSDPDKRGSVRRLTNLRNELITSLDQHPAVGDVWKEARTRYAKPSEVMDAQTLGKNILTGKIDAEELPFLTASYSDRQMQGLRVGMRSYLEQMLGKRDALTAETIRTILSPNNVQKLRWGIGDAATDSLVSAIEHESHMHTAPTRIHGGSPTASRSQAMKDWDAPDAGAGITLGDIGDAIRKPTKTAAGVALGAAEKFGVSHRRAAAEAKWARIREEAARIMTLQGPERDAVARYLVEQGPAAPYARGGIVKPRTVRQGGFVYSLQRDGSYR